MFEFHLVLPGEASELKVPGGRVPGSSKNTDWSFINSNILEMNKWNGFDHKALYQTPGEGTPVLPGT